MFINHNIKSNNEKLFKIINIISIYIKFMNIHYNNNIVYPSISKHIFVVLSLG